MKKVLSVLVVLGVVIAMAACGNKNAEEEQRIQDSIEQARIADSTLQAEAAIAAEQTRIQDSIEQARIQDSILQATATPAKKTSVTTKVKEAAKQAIDETPAKKRSGGTSK